MPEKLNATTRRLVEQGCEPRVVKAPPIEEPLAAALRALDEIANPAFGIGFRGLKQIAKRGLREVRAAQRHSQADAA